MFLFLIITLIIVIYSATKVKDRQKQLIYCFLPIFLLIGSNIGWSPDYNSYEEYYNVFKIINLKTYMLSLATKKFEPGFFLIMHYSPSYRIVILISTLLVIISYYLLFYHLISPKYYPLAFILWFYNSTFFESFFAMRSSYVVFFFVLAVIYRIKGKLILPAVLVFISGLFHNSGFILLPLIFIPYDFIYRHYRFTIITIALIILLLAVSPTVFSAIFSSAIQDTEIERYSNYIKEIDFGLGYYFLLILRTIIIGYLLFLISKREIYKYTAYFAMFMIIMYIVSSIPYLQLGYRIACYLRPFMIVTVCEIIKKSHRLESKLFVVLVFIDMCFNIHSFFKHANYHIYYESYESSYLTDII